MSKDQVKTAVAKSRVRWVVLFAFATLFSSLRTDANETENHLFILSGQSNMTGGLKSGFSRRVVATFGAKKVTIVYHCKSGRGIRFWDKDYQFPDNYRIPGKGAPSKQNKKQHGEVYGPLIEKIQNACKGKSHHSVTFIWMQGESDGMRGLGDVYEKSFLRLLDRLKADLNRKDISFVIGRINNTQLKGKHGSSWRRVRDVQVKLATDAEFGEWINTDDLSESKSGVHFPSNQYEELGSRFASKAIKLIQKRTKNVANEIQGDDKSK